MLTYAIMGALALAILWVNTLLVVGAALTPLSQLLSRLRRPLREGKIEAGHDDGILARHIVEQVGRRASDDAARQAVLFHDRAYRSELAAGVIRSGEEVLELDSRPAQVWVTLQQKREQANTPGDFEEAYRASKRAKGYARSVVSTLRSGDSVWFSDTPELWLSSFDPRPWLRTRVAMVVGFQLAMTAVSALVTWLCLYPPVFGTISTIGGALGLVHFLLVLQPLGVTVREAVKKLPNGDALLAAYRAR